MGSAAIAQTVPVESAESASTIVVTARRAAATARDEQRIAPNLVNIQAAEDIVKYPDFNAAESLGRVPGVSLAIDTGEGRFVNIRGIDGNLNGTTFGGVTLLNTQPGGTYFGGGGRAVELDTIPIGSVDRLIVRKTGLPDREAEGLGGSVEASPRTASGIKQPFADLTLGGGYQPAHKNGKIYRIEAAAGTRFGGTGKPWGIVLFGSYHEDHRGFDDLEAGYIDDLTVAPDKAFDSVDFRRNNYNRRRFGFGGELSYDPTSRSHYYLRATNAGYTESVNRQLLNLGNLGDQGANASLVDPANKNGFLAPAAGMALSLRDEQESHLNLVVAAGGNNEVGNGIKIDYQLAYTSSTYHRDYDYNSNFKSASTFPARYDNTTNPDFPVFLTAGFDPNNTAQYTLSRLTNTTERAHDREYSGRLDVLVPTTLLGGTGAFKVGAKVRLRDKIDQPLNFSYAAPATSLTQLQGPGPFNGFYGGRYAIGYSPDAGRLRSVFAGITPTSNLARNASGFFNDTENVYAGYGQYQGSFGQFGILAGVRVERTEATYRGITTTGGTVFTPSSRTSRYTDVFPTVQLRYDIQPNFVARAT